MLYDNGPLPAPNRPIGAMGRPAPYTPPLRPKMTFSPGPDLTKPRGRYKTELEMMGRMPADKGIFGMMRPPAATTQPQQQQQLQPYQTMPWLRSAGVSGGGQLPSMQMFQRGNMRDHLGNVPGHWNYQGVQQPQFHQMQLFGYQPPQQYQGNPYLPQLT